MKYVRLKDITTKITKGTTPSNIGASFTDEGINYFRSEMLGKSKYLDKSSGMMYISESTHNKLKRSQINPGDILFSMAGIYLGKLAIVQDEDVPANTNQAVALIRFDRSVNIDYLYYFMTQKSFNSYVNCMSAQAAQPNINLKQIGNLQIALPADKQQKRIADILSAYDNLIENNNKRIKLLEQMAENLYKEWFVRFRFPGYEDVELENGLPKGWEYTKLERLANISTGKCNREDAEEDGAYPLFDRSQEIKRSNVWLKDCEAIIVPGEGTGFIPRYYNGKFNLHQRCYCVEPLEKGMGFFLYQTLMMYRIYFLYVATGATVPSLRLNNFNNFKVLLPKKELCFQYNEIAEKMNDEILLLKNKNELLAKQRDMLLPRLMSEKLEV